MTAASPDSRFLACGVPGQTEPYMAGSSAEAPLSIFTLGFLGSVLVFTDGKRDCKWIVTGREALGLGCISGKERTEGIFRRRYAQRRPSDAPFFAGQGGTSDFLCISNALLVLAKR